ncbi:zinc finger protein 704-like isoform X2 [Brienomyrus brachyistius]|uniref:zinc finger protein 704-like isoform X2 n=1 Tax=Brienomyrus brachyistius TaxID=42636 RepID=UPI0020B374B1|nr:zinc finger protein 704-like isoform X2 [Brienomyrus brachyistius]
MTSKRLLHRSLVGMRVGTAAGQAGSSSHAADGKPYGKTGAPVDCGIMLACKSDHTSGSFLYTLMLDDGTLRDPREDVLLNGIDLTAPGKEKFIFDPKITARNSDVDHRIEADLILVQKRSPTQRLVLNGKKLDDQMHTEGRGPGRRGEEPRNDPQPPPADAPLEDLAPLASSQIPVPRNRKPAGHADKEVMAAAVLTSLSSSPMVLGATPGTPAAVPEPASRAWKECLSASYSSSTSGNWSWDASDQSVPSTPSPPLSNDVSKGFLLPSQGDDNAEESEITHFLFEDPIPRKRKNSMKVMFKCLWKNCEKVLSTSSGIQRHIRTVHLGRNGDSDYSDGEEDFYYSEIEVNMDTLSEGLSSLTPTSPTTATAPPVFPVPELPHSEPAHIALRCTPCPTPLSQSAPSTLCHIRTDHAYQAAVPPSTPARPRFVRSESGVSISWQPPSVVFKGLPGPAGPIRPMGVGEKRHSVQHATVTKSHPPAFTAAKPSTGSRKPRGEAKKCRKVYGMEKKDMWCTACRWKKACQRFTD